MPWHDWQFCVVTATAMWGAWTLLRQLLPSSGPAGPDCGACAAGAGACACARKPTAATATQDPPLVMLGDRRRGDDAAS